ncbi:MAG: hypothetical protein CMJ46_05775 [Planctomyces sp.]|nr:hypothetical protein [Planctomyces sp.]
MALLICNYTKGLRRVTRNQDAIERIDEITQSVIEVIHLYRSDYILYFVRITYSETSQEAIPAERMTGERLIFVNVSIFENGDSARRLML